MGVILIYDSGGGARRRTSFIYCCDHRESKTLSRCERTQFDELYDDSHRGSLQEAEIKYKLCTEILITSTSRSERLSPVVTVHSMRGNFGVKCSVTVVSHLHFLFRFPIVESPKFREKRVLAIECWTSRLLSFRQIHLTLLPWQISAEMLQSYPHQALTLGPLWPPWPPVHVLSELSLHRALWVGIRLLTTHHCRRLI